MSSEVNTGVVHQAEVQVDQLLGYEYELEPVPLGARRSAFSVTMIWIDFPTIIAGVRAGSLPVLCNPSSACARRT